MNVMKILTLEGLFWKKNPLKKIFIQNPKADPPKMKCVLFFIDLSNPKK